MSIFILPQTRYNTKELELLSNFSLQLIYRRKKKKRYNLQKTTRNELLKNTKQYLQ